LKALEMLKALKDNNQPIPKIILLDLNMPRMGGIEFLTELRKDEGLKDISVFVMTTSSEETDIVDAYRLNVAGYIVKPLSIETFINAVSTLNNYWTLCEYPNY
jgi:CheY-like chemotaxis protein